MAENSRDPMSHQDSCAKEMRKKKGPFSSWQLLAALLHYIYSLSIVTSFLKVISLSLFSFHVAVGRVFFVCVCLWKEGGGPSA